MPHERFPWIWYLLALLVIGAFFRAHWMGKKYVRVQSSGLCIPALSTATNSSLGVMGWLMLVSIPGGLFAFVGWLSFSDSPSWQLAKRFCRSSSSDSAADCDSFVVLPNR